MLAACRLVAILLMMAVAIVGDKLPLAVLADNLLSGGVVAHVSLQGGRG